jgi:hypothetical protein
MPSTAKVNINNKIKTMKIETQWYKSDMPLTGFNKETGVWGMYSQQRRHYWFGIKGIFGFRYSKIWGYDY